MIHFLKSFLLALVIPVMPMAAVEQEAVEPVVILGGGVGSLTSAMYLGRAGHSPLVIVGPNPGGLLTQSHSVQNWPGLMEINGAELTENMREQAEANGARFADEEVVSVDFSKRPFLITTKRLDGSQKQRSFYAESCIIAMGTKPNFLGIPGEQEHWGHGVTNCAICDGSLFKDQVVGIVGGGDAAVLEALYLSNIARKVHVFVRGDSLRAIEEKRVQVLREKPNVQFHYKTTVTEVRGDGNSLKGVVLKKNSKKIPFAIDGLFLAIGSTPNSAMFKSKLKLDQAGYIQLEKDQQTSVNGVYAIGDIVDPTYKQAVSAAGDGAKAALQAQQYLSDRSNKLIVKNKASVQKVTPAVTEVIDISSVEQFRRETQTGTIPVIVDFYATWCGPCKRISPVLENSAEILSGKVKFLKVNVDHFSEISTEYGIRAMPTVVLLDPSGVELERKVGLDQISSLLTQLESRH